jgi:hypothetical protein
MGRVQMKRSLSCHQRLWEYNSLSLKVQLGQLMLDGSPQRLNIHTRIWTEIILGE